MAVVRSSFREMEQALNRLYTKHPHMRASTGTDDRTFVRLVDPRHGIPVHARTNQANLYCTVQIRRLDGQAYCHRRFADTQKLMELIQEPNLSGLRLTLVGNPRVAAHERVWRANLQIAGMFFLGGYWVERSSGDKYFVSEWLIPSMLDTLMEALINAPDRAVGPAV